jgi:hypothetical protein
MATTQQRRAAIERLQPGTVVGHANPELAAWEGVIKADRHGRWWTMRWNGDVRVKWTAGIDGNGTQLADHNPSWIEATAVTIKGQCPACARPAHFVFAGGGEQRSEGWYHDAQVDRDTCWVGKAAFEAGWS